MIWVILNLHVYSFDSFDKESFLILKLKQRFFFKRGLNVCQYNVQVGNGNFGGARRTGQMPSTFRWNGGGFCGKVMLQSWGGRVSKVSDDIPYVRVAGYKTYGWESDLKTTVSLTLINKPAVIRSIRFLMSHENGDRSGVYMLFCSVRNRTNESRISSAHHTI